MTTRVVTIGLDTCLPEIARLLVERGISGVPVMHEGTVAGMVSEGDLLRRHEIGTDSAGDGPRDYVKSHAMRAADIMTAPAICAADDAPLATVASILAKRRIKRVPVLRGKVLVGIVSRANLVEALAVRAMPRARNGQSDEALRRVLLGELLPRQWWHACSNVIVNDGVAHLWGVYAQPDDRDAARIAAENTPGVRRVEDHRVSLARLPSMG